MKDGGRRLQKQIQRKIKIGGRLVERQRNGRRQDWWKKVGRKGVGGRELWKKSCLKCKGQMLACAREGLEKQLLEWVKSDDEKISDRMMKNAQAVANRGMDAILALMGRGIGEATCQRIMRKVQRGDKEGLLEAIHIAEIEYARTRRFWG